VSDIDTEFGDSLKALDPQGPIREADFFPWHHSCLLSPRKRTSDKTGESSSRLPLLITSSRAGDFFDPSNLQSLCPERYNSSK
jgi:hypothetical protein